MSANCRFFIFFPIRFSSKDKRRKIPFRKYMCILQKYKLSI